MRTLFALRCLGRGFTIHGFLQLVVRAFENVVGTLEASLSGLSGLRKGSSRRVFGDAAAGLHRSALLGYVRV